VWDLRCPEGSFPFHFAVKAVAVIGDIQIWRVILVRIAVPAAAHHREETQYGGIFYIDAVGVVI